MLAFQIIVIQLIKHSQLSDPFVGYFLVNSVLALVIVLVADTIIGGFLAAMAISFYLYLSGLYSLLAEAVINETLMVMVLWYGAYSGTDGGIWSMDRWRRAGDGYRAGFVGGLEKPSATNRNHPSA